MAAAQHHQQLQQQQHRHVSVKFSDVVAAWDVTPVLMGEVDRVPPLASRTVRVFLSSTFSGGWTDLDNITVTGVTCCVI